MRTNAAAHACWCWAGFADSEYSKIVSGIDCTECVGFQSTSCPAMAQVKRSGAVSPAARAIARVVPVRMPPDEVGSLYIDASGALVQPDPARLGHEETNGCIHLTNWDAERLATLARPGFVVDVRA